MKRNLEEGLDESTVVKQENSGEENKNKVYYESSLDRLIRISNQLVIGAMPLALGLQIVSDNSISISHLEKTISSSVGIGGYIAVQASAYILTILPFLGASVITYLGVGKLFRGE